MKMTVGFAVIACALLVSSAAAQQCGTKKKCADCAGVAGCVWCEADGLNFGTCATGTTCDSKMVNGLNFLSSANGKPVFTVKTIDAANKCTGLSTKDTPYVEAADCKACLTAGASFCKLKSKKSTASGYICLKSGSTYSTQCKDVALNTGVFATLDEVKAEANCPNTTNDECAKKLSCDECNKAKCMWCGATLYDKKANYVAESGKTIGKCIALPDATKTNPTEYCAAVKFTDATKVYQYAVKEAHDYEPRVVPFSTELGWKEMKSCGAEIVDADSTLKCEKCIEGKHKFCQLTTTKSDKTEIKGGLCLKGKEEDVDKTCKTLAVAAKADKFFKTEAASLKTCAGCLATFSGALVPLALLSAFISYF